jgi:hypothetical protein
VEIIFRLEVGIFIFKYFCLQDVVEIRYLVQLMKFGEACFI